jgi:DNA-binding response OmpR family regulator
VTDNPSFSGQVSELMLRAGVRTIRFAQIADALELARTITPDLVLVHVPRDNIEASWACYQALQGDARLGSIPVLIYAPPTTLAERAVGSPAQGLAAAQMAESDMLMARIHWLLGVALPAWQRADMRASEHAFPTGRDDM